MLGRHRDRLLQDGWHIAKTGQIAEGEDLPEATEGGSFLPGPRLVHHPISWGLQRRVDVACPSPETIAALLAAEFALHPRIILTTECFYWENRDIAQITALKNLLPDGARVLCWLRNRFEHIESLYSQAVFDHAFQGSVMDFYSTHEVAFDYGAMLSQWTNTFGTGQVECRIYNSRLNPFISFLESLGLDAHRYESEALVINRSVPPALAPVLRAVVAPDSIKKSLAFRMKQVVDKMPKCRLLRAGDVGRILQTTEPGDAFLRELGVDVGPIRDPALYLSKPHVNEVMPDATAKGLAALLMTDESITRAAPR